MQVSSLRLQGPQQRGATKLLSMSRQQLSIVVGLLTGHLGLNGHLHKIGKDIKILYTEGVSMKLLNICYVNVKPWQYHRVNFLDKVLESFNNSHKSQWIYFDCLPQK